MLVLSRKRWESVLIGGSVRVTVSAIEGSRVRLAIEAPLGVSIYRQELIDRSGADFQPTVADQTLFPSVDEFGGPVNVIDRCDTKPTRPSIVDLEDTPGLNDRNERMPVPIRMLVSGNRRMRERKG